MNDVVKGLTNECVNGIIGLVIYMARKAIDEDDPLVPKQVSIPLSLRRKLRRASEETGKSEAQIVREALVVELEKDEYTKGA